MSFHFSHWLMFLLFAFIAGCGGGSSSSDGGSAPLASAETRAAFIAETSGFGWFIAENDDSDPLYLYELDAGELPKEPTLTETLYDFWATDSFTDWNGLNWVDDEDAGYDFDDYLAGDPINSAAILTDMGWEEYYSQFRRFVEADDAIFVVTNADENIDSTQQLEVIDVENLEGTSIQDYFNSRNADMNDYLPGELSFSLGAKAARVGDVTQLNSIYVLDEPVNSMFSSLTVLDDIILSDIPIDVSLEVLTEIGEFETDTKDAAVSVILVDDDAANNNKAFFYEVDYTDTSNIGYTDTGLSADWTRSTINGEDIITLVLPEPIVTYADYDWFIGGTVIFSAFDSAVWYGYYLNAGFVYDSDEQWLLNDIAFGDVFEEIDFNLVVPE